MISSILSFLTVAFASSAENESFALCAISTDSRVDSFEITSGYPGSLSFGNGTEASFLLKGRLLYQETRNEPAELYIRGGFVSTEPDHVGEDIHAPLWEVENSLLHFDGSSDFSVCLGNGRAEDFLIVGDGKNTNCGGELVNNVTLLAVY